MARIHYYEFPLNVSAEIREANGAESINNTCISDPERYNDPLNFNPSEGCVYRNGFRGCIDCTNLKCTEAEYEIMGITVTRAKQLLSEYGGRAYTRHIDRDGCCFEVTPIRPGKNNSRFKYNQHL